MNRTDAMTLIATALDVDADTLAKALEIAKAGNVVTERVETHATEATCTATAKSTGRRCTLKAQDRGVCHKHGATVAPTVVTHATKVNVPAKVTIGFRASGSLARRSAYVVAEALGLDGHKARTELLGKSQEEITALLGERGITAEIVPAASL